MKRSAIQCDVTFVHENRVRAARKALPGEPVTDRLSEMFKVLGDPTRLKVVLALGREELCVCDVAALLGMTGSAISHQLRILKNLHIVKYRKQGKMAYYSLADRHVENILKVASRHAAE